MGKQKHQLPRPSLQPPQPPVPQPLQQPPGPPAVDITDKVTTSMTSGLQAVPGVQTIPMPAPVTAPIPPGLAGMQAHRVQAAKDGRGDPADGPQSAGSRLPQQPLFAQPSLPAYAQPQPPAAYDSVLIASLNQQRHAGQQFWLGVQPDGEVLSWEKFDTLELMIAKIQELEGQDVSVFPFLGVKMAVTAGPMRYLATPLGWLPLFKLPTLEELDASDGYLGTRAERSMLPVPEQGGEERGAFVSNVEQSQSAAAADSAAASDAADDEDDDEEEATLESGGVAAE